MPENNKGVIPESEWVWQGHAAHFCGADGCRFRLATRVGAYIVSTVGDWFPNPQEERQPLRGQSDSFLETLVFPAGEQMKCGCTNLASVQQIETDTYPTPAEAQAGHLHYCRKYAGLL